MAAILIAWSLALAGTARAVDASISLPGNGGFCNYEDYNASAPLPAKVGKIKSVTVTVDANDVDEASGEVDEVSLNGVVIGNLTGADFSDSTTVFELTEQQIADALGGASDATVDIDVSKDAYLSWCVLIYGITIDIEYAGADAANVCSNSGAGNSGEQAACEGEVDGEHNADDVDPGNSGGNNKAPNAPPGKTT